MDFSLSFEQVALRDSLRRFVERELAWEERTRIVRLPSGVDPDHWALFAEQGWLGAGLACEQGGFGGSAVEDVIIAEELGRALSTDPFAAHAAATRMLAEVDGEVALELVTALVSGERRIVPALTEEQGRGDWRIVSARVGGGCLSGGKTMVEGGDTADALLVAAMTDAGPALCLVNCGTTGVTRQVYRSIDNRRIANFHFNSAEVQVLATGSRAEAAVERGVDHALLCHCAEAVGMMDAALMATRDYLRVRRQFGTTIGSFQALQHRMADMLIEVEMTRSALFHALGAALMGDAKARSGAASAAKVQAATSAGFVGGQAIQLHGGMGVTEESIVSHYYRRLYVIARILGGADLHVERFACIVDTDS